MPTRSLVLASASPRRAELLRLAGLSFTVRPADLDETIRPGESPAGYAGRLARDKALAAGGGAEPSAILAADTIVVIDGRILGKPRDRADATRMIGLLAGRTHEVLTAIALRLLPEETTGSDLATTRVSFAPMSKEEIAWYAGTGEGLDKAGAYALQGRGALFIAGIEGSYTNVIGLPLERLHPLLTRSGFRLGA